MSMTREEAIEVLENRLSQCQYVYDTSQFPDISYPGAKREIDALEIALTALRPVSREQVEKVWRGEWNYSHTTETDHFAVVKCSKCGHKAFAMALYVKDGNFCPACGAAQTDEAVEMVMERMDALHDTEN